MGSIKIFKPQLSAFLQLTQQRQLHFPQKIFLRMQKIKPVAARFEAQTLPLCYAPLLSSNCLTAFFSFRLENFMQQKRTNGNINALMILKMSKNSY